MSEDLREVFGNPGSQYRGKPFWAWNGRLEADELRRQIRVMHQMGLGGFFMHSRVGLGTAYLSDEWFEMVRACVDEARELGMEAWLYDEDRWPSGAAGGLVTSDPTYRHRSLRLLVSAPADAPTDRETLAVFCARIDGNMASDVRRLEEGWEAADLPDGASVLSFFVVADEPSTWFNNGTYLDTMSHEAVRKFIEVTHEAYRREVGEDFGELIPGIFTDEPHHGGMFGSEAGHVSEGTQVPWTDRLPEVFRERYGCDVLDHLPELFFNVDGAELSRARWHYHDCTCFLFADAFGRQCYEWCEQNGLMLTGHVLAESTLRSQANVGGAPMRFYEYMQAPGIDQLTEHWREYSTAKQCSSMQNQMGRRWMLSELYGCTGWDWPFEGHKAVGDWQACLGVNLRCQHLSWYTMAGQAKRDYPASILHQSPWWQHYGCVEDYFARVNTVLAAGEAVRKLLVVHPIESCWARATVGWREDAGIDRLEEAFDSTINWLLEEHLDFDFGDEDVMARHGNVEAGDGPRLVVGRAEYDVVLVPPLDTIRASTLDLLREFAGAGGTVVFCAPEPGWVDAEPSEAARELAGDCVRVAFERAAVADAVAGARVLSIRDETGAEKAPVFYRLQSEDGELRLFMINTDREQATGPLTVEIEAEGAVQLWDAETAERFAVEAEPKDGKLIFRTDMPPTGSRIYVVTGAPEELPPLPDLGEVRALEPGELEWACELTDHNVLVFDMPEFRVGDGDWKGPTEVLKADAQIRDAIGLPRRSGQMVQPWARQKAEGPKERIALRYRFDAAALPHGPLFLALENPRCFEIALNGSPISLDAECGWWVDPAIRLLPLDDAALRRGENVLELRGAMDGDCDLEIVYLLGEFAVELDGARARIAGPVEPPGFGDWTGQGLPFYSGSAVWRARIRPEVGPDERAFVEVPRFGGACARVLVDGREAGVIGWQPHEVEVTDLVAGKAECELAVEVVSSRRNAFGPLHHAEARPSFVGPHTFVSSGEEWRDEYSLVPAGCLEPPRLSIRTAG